MLRTILFTLTAASLSSAHFVLNWPYTAGFDDDNEPNSPCGGVTPIVNDTNPEVQVDRFAVQMRSTHPAGNWSFYGTTNTEAPYDFTQIVPSVSSSGIGDFCLEYLSVPSEWAGKSGVLQVVDGSVDGTLYQCAPVRFVTGSNSTTGPNCHNATGFTATWSASQVSTNSSGAAASSASAAATSPTSTSSAGAAMATGMGSVLGLGLMVAGLAL